MPAFRIKNESNTECCRLHDLHTCRRPAKISKSSQAQAKTFGREEELDILYQTYQDASSNIEVFLCNSTAAGIDGPFTQLLKASSFSPEPVSITRQDSRSDENPTNLETIFSPDRHSGVSLLKPASHSDGITFTTSDYETNYDCSKLPHLVPVEREHGACIPNEYHQSCMLSDFYDADGISDIPFDSSIGLTDVLNSTCSVHEFTSSDIMIDMEEGYMTLPSPERTVESSNTHGYDDSVQESLLSFDEVCLCLETQPQNEITCEFDNWEDIECHDQQLLLKSFPSLPEAVSSILLPPETQDRKHVTLVLDLDETLVHSTMEHCDDADFTFPIFFNMKHQTVYVRRRPFLQMFLEKVAQMFEIVIFTASQSVYAEKLLDILDPDGKIISKRVYRESCIFSEGYYTKDLTILGVDLAKVAIVDNTPQVFCLQVNNGIPIKSWFGDPLDQALVQLLPFLETLVDAEDVRPIICKQFNNNDE